MAISVSINAGQDANSSSVTATGSIQHIINDTERTAFNIQDAALKSAVATYFGQAPNDAYVCSPTPWGDLYQTYGWPQIQTLFSVVSASILGVTSEPTIVASQIFQNSSSVPAEFNCGITQEVSVTTESNWSNSSTVEVGQTISYDISFLGAGAGGETSLSYSETWEQGGSESESVTLGSSSGVTVTLQPGQSVVSELTASKGKLTVQIVYQQTLSGVTAINYGNTYKGHHFWALNINAVMSAAGYPTTITTTETIEIDFYANSKIVLKDPQGQAIASFVVGPKHA
ncbi:MAG: follicular epithelium yolk protein subunit [Microcystis aeruginosa G11-01]|nr:follicular epithelium yolk protein subunit [Microcystis aeruginosa G11-01]